MKKELEEDKISKKEVLKLLLKLFEGCYIGVNHDNMNLYDESPDYVVDYEELIKRIERVMMEGDENKDE